MNFRPRRSRYTKDQWEVQRDRFQIEPGTPQPVDDHTTSVKGPIQKLITSLGLNLDTIQQRLMNQWDTIAGKPLCRHIRPGPIQNGTLTVFVSNSAMLAELTRFQGPALLKNIQAALEKDSIKKLHFMIDPDTRTTRR